MSVHVVRETIHMFSALEQTSRNHRAHGSVRHQQISQERKGNQIGVCTTHRNRGPDVVQLSRVVDKVRATSDRVSSNVLAPSDLGKWEDAKLIMSGGVRGMVADQAWATAREDDG